MNRLQPFSSRTRTIDANLTARLDQFAALASLLKPGGGRAKLLSCERCGRIGTDLTFEIDGVEVANGAEVLAVGNNREVIFGNFEPVITHHHGGVVTLGTRLVGEPIRKAGKVEIICGCGYRRPPWHTSSG